MIEHDDRLEELAHLYPLGGLDEDERAAVDQHLAAGCDRCEQRLLEGLRVSGQLLSAIDPVPPSPSVKQALLARVRHDATPDRGVPERAPAVGSTSWGWLGAAAAVLVAIGVGVYALAIRDQSAALQTALRDEEAARLAADGRIAELESRLATLTAPGARAVSLSGQGESIGARARAFLDTDTRQLLLYVYDLPPLPDGQTYQLWVIVEGMPISAGTFDVQPDGSARFAAEPLPAVEADAAVALAVTVEPAGGVPQPTGPMVLVEG